MPTVNYVTIDGVAYSPKHPKAVAMRTVDKLQKAAAEARQRVSGYSQEQKAELSKAARAFVSTDEAKLNKTEKKLLGRLRWKYINIGAPVRIQAIRLELAAHCTLLPDFSVWFMGKLIFYECKGGFIRDDAIVKLKTAARLYPEFDFWLCQYKKGEWKETLMPK